MRDQRARLLSATLGFLSLTHASQNCGPCTAASTTGVALVMSSPAWPAKTSTLSYAASTGARRATFFPSGFEHSLTSSAASAFALSPWAAVQQAARDALAKLQHDGDTAPRDWTLTDESPIRRRKCPDTRHRLLAIDMRLRGSSLTVSYGRSPAVAYDRRCGAAMTCRTSVAVILILEDEVAVAELIAETLIQGGAEARVAVSAAHASLIVKTERPDLILLDINLPDSAGTLALGRLRELQPDVPIIMLTANTDDELARATLRRGAFDYISKPFNIDHLMHAVGVALAS